MESHEPRGRTDPLYGPGRQGRGARTVSLALRGKGREWRSFSLQIKSSRETLNVHLTKLVFFVRKCLTSRFLFRKITIRFVVVFRYLSTGSYL